MMYYTKIPFRSVYPICQNCMCVVVSYKFLKIIWQTASYNKLLFLRYIYYFICGQWPPQMGHNCHGAGLIPLPQWNTLLGAGGHGGMKWVKRPDIGATVN